LHGAILVAASLEAGVGPDGVARRGLDGSVVSC
jgi:hypothetical protein